jgi:hypothetical protein
MSTDEQNVVVYVGGEETVLIPEEVWRQIDEECEREEKKRDKRFLGCSPLPKEIHELIKKKRVCTDEVR